MSLNITWSTCHCFYFSQTLKGAIFYRQNQHFLTIFWQSWWWFSAKIGVFTIFPVKLAHFQSFLAKLAHILRFSGNLLMIFRQIGKFFAIFRRSGNCRHTLAPVLMQSTAVSHRHHIVHFHRYLPWHDAWLKHVVHPPEVQCN